MAERSFFVRNVYALRDLELFLVTAIATSRIVRAALTASGWPQLGRGKIHVAHLLWGGLGMLIALILFMALQGRLWRQLATLLAGIGFGLFIDELGKFITADNDYFFQPTVAIIYLVFVVLLILSRALARESAMSPQSALVNAFDVAKEAVLRDLEEATRARALYLLARSDQSDPVVRDLTQMVRRMSVLPKGPPRLHERLRAWLRGFYGSLVRRSWFKRLVIGWYVVIALALLLSPIASAAGVDLDSPRFAQIGKMITALVIGAMVIVGVIRWRRSRLAAYRWFKYAMLVTIFVYEFFAFYEVQLLAISGLVIILLTYSTTRLMIRGEQARAESRLLGGEAATE